MADRYDDRGWDRERERERDRERGRGEQGREGDRWRESWQGGYGTEGGYGNRGEYLGSRGDSGREGYRSDWNQGRENYRADWNDRERDRERGWGSQNRDWEVGRSSDWNRGEDWRQNEGRGREWSRSMPRSGNPSAEGGDIGRSGFGEQYGRGREYEGGGSRYEGQHYMGQGERYGSSSGHWAGGMGSSRGDTSGFQNQMGGIGQSGSQGGYRNDWSGYTGLGGGGYGNYGSYGGGIGQYYGEQQRGHHIGRGPKGYQRSDDRIREDVSERLTQHPDIDATEIEVQVASGEVTLTGTVDHRHAKRLAEDVAENVSGVKEVHNQLRVQQHHGGRQHEKNEANVGVAGGTAKTEFGGDASRMSTHSITPEPAGAKRK